MNYYEEREKNQEEFKATMNKAFSDYLENQNQEFSPTMLLEFCKNEIYIDYEKTPQGQENIKSWLKAQTNQLENYYHSCGAGKNQALTFLKKIYKRFPNEHIKPWNSFIDSVVNFDDSQDFRCNIFERRFPIGTISYIGARPGRGKTTVLVNIALDALNQGKPVIFVTAEETTKQILTRFILSEAYAKTIKPNGQLFQRTIYETFKPRTTLFNFIKDRSKQLPGMTIPNGDLFQEATDRIQSYVDSNKLQIFEAYGATWGELTNFIENQEAGSVILVDYIQHLKSPEHLATQTRQIQIQETSHQLADLAGSNGLILISGAQFNRETRNGGGNSPDMKKADSFDETSFREAGDIEQDGHILIGIGKNPGTEEFFYSCMKDREANPDNGTRWKLTKDFRFSYLQGEKNDKGEKVEYIPPVKPGKDKTTQETTEADKLNAMKNFSYGGK